MNLPHSLIRGEILQLQIFVHNYLNVDLKNVSVRLLATNDFKLVLNEDKSEPITELNSNLLIPLIKSQSGESVSLNVTPVHIGLVSLTARGVSSVAGDAERRTIRVKPEGIEQIENLATLIDLREGKNTFDIEYRLKAPANTVPDSEYCKVQIVGNLFGSSLNNLNRLINKPSGCGEQNMLYLTPNIYALR